MRTWMRIAAIAAICAGTAGPAGADIWGVKTHDPLSQPPTTLFRISSDGGALAEIAQVHIAGGSIEVDGLALSPGSDLFGFQLDASGSRMVAIDQVTGEATPCGPVLPGRDVRGAAFLSGGRLLVLDAAGNALVEISTATGEPVGAEIGLWLAGQRFDIQTMVDLVEVPTGALVLAQFNEFFALDAVSGTLTSLHRDDAIGGDGLAVGISGIAWMPEAVGGPRFAAYDVQQDDDIFTYDPAHSYQRANLHLRIVPGYNAGRGDLASMPDVVTGVEAGTAGRRYGVLDVRPNPFNPRTTLSFEVARPGSVRLAVFDLAGRLVRTLVAGDVAAGRHEVDWDGRDAAGMAVASGAYLARLESGGGVDLIRLALVR